jgi:HEAT repeat protein
VLAHSAPGVETLLRGDLATRKTASFNQLFTRWETRHGSQAVAPLVKIARDRKLQDPDRYVALMGAAKLGGRELAPVLATFLKDKSWMIRSGALRALSALGHPDTAPSVLPLLRDPALVVRSEAVDAVEKLRPAGAVEALMSAIEHGANYHAGKAQWVPQKALSALVTLKAKGIEGRLRPLLKHELDPALQLRTVETLEKLTGRSLKSGAPLRERVREWESALAAPRS